VYIPQHIIDAFRPAKISQEIQQPESQSKEICPIGCDPTRTEVAISKPGRGKKGNFVSVYYRKNRNAAEPKSIEERSKDFWAELTERSERANSKGKDDLAARLGQTLR
jgi:hypothetical protein